MKRILISLLLAFVALGSMAQNELQKCIDNLPPARLVGTDSEQGHHRLDSLYNLHIMTYELPYHSHYDKLYADGVIKGILLAYNKDLPQYTGGFCSSNLLRTSNAIESRTIQMYYGENLDPFTVGGKKVNIPSYLVSVGETIELKDSSRSLDKFKGALEANASRVVPKWLEMDKNNVAKVVAVPAREDIDLPIEEHLIVELYSK